MPCISCRSHTQSQVVLLESKSELGLHHGTALAPDDHKDCPGIALYQIYSFHVHLHGRFPHHLPAHVFFILCFSQIWWLYQWHNLEWFTYQWDIWWVSKGLVDVFLLGCPLFPEQLVLVCVLSMTRYFPCHQCPLLNTVPVVLLLVLLMLFLPWFPIGGLYCRAHGLFWLVLQMMAVLYRRPERLDYCGFRPHSFFKYESFAACTILSPFLVPIFTIVPVVTWDGPGLIIHTGLPIMVCTLTHSIVPDVWWF